MAQLLPIPHKETLPLSKLRPMCTEEQDALMSDILTKTARLGLSDDNDDDEWTSGLYIALIEKKKEPKVI